MTLGNYIRDKFWVGAVMMKGTPEDLCLQLCLLSLLQMVLELVDLYPCVPLSFAENIYSGLSPQCPCVQLSRLWQGWGGILSLQGSFWQRPLVPVPLTLMGSFLFRLRRLSLYSWDHAWRGTACLIRVMYGRCLWSRSDRVLISFSIRYFLSLSTWPW